MLITSLSQLDLNDTYSYADYLKWRFDERLELIKGKIFKMSPAPSMQHQQISRRLCRDFFGFFTEKQPCQVFDAPFDVRLYDKNKSLKANKDIFTVVQPDICVICDKKKLDNRGCLGSPDLIIEILSLGNSKREMKTKFDLYQESGVREYWLVYPYEESVTKFILNDADKFEYAGQYANDDMISPTIFPNFTIDLKDIFYHDEEENDDDEENIIRIW
jgi:Uma2 family endonuclease